MTIPNLLGPKRRLFQWTTSLLILLVPWIQPGGDSLFRIDISSLSLHLFGQILRIEELYLFLLFCLTFGVAFLLITLISGRIWCGWACPQTTLNDVAEWFARKLGLKISHNRLQGPAWKKLVAQLLYLCLALLVAANLLWYFIEPQRFFLSLLQTEMTFGVLATFLVLTLLIYLDLALIRRLMCKEFCPYGRIQTSLVDPGTLTLQLPATEKSRCIRCNSCVRSCPMEIDIRNGYQVECINCGRCLDACRQVMLKRQQPGLIYYTFGASNQGSKLLLNPRTLLLSLALISLISVLSVAVMTRAEATLKVAHSHTAISRMLKDGQHANFFNAWLNNRGPEDTIFHLQARNSSGKPLVIKGPTADLKLRGGENRKLDFVLVTQASDQPFMIEFVLLNALDEELALAKAQITPVSN